MYTSYFGLKEKPFTIAPDPRYLFMSELHREALAHLLYGLQSDGCFILFTGEIGTGKTTVCRCFLGQLPPETDIAIILNPKVSVLDLLRTICEELAIPENDEAPSNKKYIDLLNAYLLDAHARGRTTAIIIDEAQNLDKDVLEQLRLLTNLETNTHKLLKIILLGQPELHNVLAAPEMLQLNQRITSRYHLAPLGPDDVRRYIRHRLMVAGGGTQRLFTGEAIRHVARLSHGIPRIINLLCDRALLGAYVEGASVVSLNIVKKAAREVLQAPGPRTGRPDRSRAILLVAVLAILGISLPLLYYYRATVHEAAGRIIMRLDSFWVGRADGTPRSGDMTGTTADNGSSPLITIGKLKKIAGSRDEAVVAPAGTDSGNGVQMQKAGESPQ
jgi:general secretion pathway protein A